MGIFDGIPLTNQELIEEGLPLPNELSLYDIAIFWSDDKKRQDRLMEAMYKAFNTGKLRCKKDDEAAYFNEGVISPYSDYEELVTSTDKFLRWLESEGEPKPTGCLLAKWLQDNELPTDSTKAASKSKSEPRELITDMAASNLLNEPLKKDDWFDVIADATNELYRQLNKLPNETQLWGELWTTPPLGYKLSTGLDKGEDCLMMPGIRPLSRSAFSKRWKNYTSNNAQ